MSYRANTTRSDEATDSQAIISLGSNLGLTRGSIHLSPESILRSAFTELQKLSSTPLIISSLYRTAPMDCPPDSADFFNAIAMLQVRPELSAVELIKELHALEVKFGRLRTNTLNQPRPLDLDLISFGRLQCNEPGLILPHPRALERSFVMDPLAEIAPELRLPGQQSTVMSLAQQLKSNQESLQRVERLSDFNL